MTFFNLFKNKKFFLNTFSFLFFLFPISLILGNFITNIVILLIVFFFSIDYLSDKNKQIKKFFSNTKVLKILLISFFFFIILIFSSIQNNYSLIKSLAYSRFLIFFFCNIFLFSIIIEIL